MYKKKPFFIVFEGVEGCGKSYQSKKLFNNLKKKKIDTVLTREPGGTKSAELIRNLILKDYFHVSDSEKFDKYTDTLLYLAARNEHVKIKIIPSLKNKKVVICDRFIDSTLAYQGYAGKLDLSTVIEVNKISTGEIYPDLTFIFDINPTQGIERALKEKSRETRFEEKDITYHKKIRD